MSNHNYDRRQRASKRADARMCCESRTDREESLSERSCQSRRRIGEAGCWLHGRQRRWLRLGQPGGKGHRARSRGDWTSARRTNVRRAEKSGALPGSDGLVTFGRRARTEPARGRRSRRGGCRARHGCGCYAAITAGNECVHVCRKMLRSKYDLEAQCLTGREERGHTRIGLSRFRP